MSNDVVAGEPASPSPFTMLGEAGLVCADGVCTVLGTATDHD